MKRIFSKVLPSASVLAMLMATPSLAQQAAEPTASTTAGQDQDEAEDEDDDEIVVTGTFIRGIAPAGANSFGVDQEDVAASGAISTNELLTTIPQVANMFNEANATATSLNSAGGFSTGINFQTQVTRPTLRNLSPTTASGSSTLVLVDGHRIVSAGVTQAAPDADIIPPGALERVEVVTDGGSSLYGADAVGGVINFITRRSYDGVGFSGHYGVGSDYENYDGSIIAGTDWDSGSAFASITHSHRSAIFGSDRDYIRSLNYNPNVAVNGAPVPFTLACAESNVTVAGAQGGVYAVNADGTALGPKGSANRCDGSDYQTIIPEEERDALLLGLNQDLTSWATLSVRAYSSERDTYGNGGPFQGTNGASVQIRSGHPDYIPRFVGDVANQAVNYNFGPINGYDVATQYTHLESWGITPTLTVDLGADWQLTLMSNYGRSETIYRNRQINGAALTRLTNTDLTVNPLWDPNFAFNPYEVTDNTPEILDEILNQGNIWGYGRGAHTMVNHRAVVDGPLFSLPGGEVRAAAGAEYLDESFIVRQGSVPTGGENSATRRTYERDVSAVFAELNIPIIGEANRLPLVESFSLSLSSRYDDYSDFGGTTNPRIAFTYEPTDWLLLRGNWGESFNAPTVVDQGNSLLPAGISTYNQFYPVDEDNGHGDPTPGQLMMFWGPLGGSAPPLTPQEATTWSFGFDLAPPIVPDLRLSATYYNIEYRGEISQPRFFDPGDMLSLYPNFITYYENDAQFSAFLQGVLAGDFNGTVSNPETVEQFISNPSGIYAFIDARKRNLSSSRHEGVDFSANYSHDVGIGMLDASVSGNYRTHYSTSIGGDFIKQDLDFGPDPGPRFRYRANLGLTIDDFYGRVTYTHNGEFHAKRSNDLFGQTEVGAFNVVDLFFRYNLGEIGAADDLAVTLNINNVANTEPPRWRANGANGIINGSTLGRVFMLGVTADF